MWIDKRIDFVEQGAFDDAHVAALSKSYTITWDEIPVSVTGCFKIYPAVWTCWMIVDERVRECGLGFARRSREAIKMACTDNGIIRLTTSVNAGNGENIRFARLMGFMPEFVQFNAGPHARGDIVGMVYWHGGRYERQAESTRARSAGVVAELLGLDQGRGPLHQGRQLDGEGPNGCIWAHAGQ